jgi:SHAQKYF class myb-like DNA-binding protein
MSETNRPTHGFNVSPQDQARQAIYASTAKMSSTKSHNQSGSSKQNQSLKIVETGQEHTGRWTREEHNAFLLALQQYGKEWKKVAAKVKTRTVVQTRTHAQKYFQKLQKGLSNEKGDVEMGTVAEAKKILPIASARRSGQSPFVKKGGRKKQDRSLLATAMSTQVRQAAAATQAAAQLMTQMSKVNTMNEEQSMLSPPPGHNPQMGGVYSAQSVQAGFVHPGSAGGVYPIGTNFGTPMSNNNMHFHNQHQVHSQMKIIAPQPDITMKKNMFPEPSPAACGKRKAIELAAAQMLAGVAASGGSAKSRSGDMSKRTTPPPDAKNGELNAVKLRDDFTAAVASASSAMTNSTGAGSLQIINPENLQHNEFRQKNLGHEPVTPWDGQLEALSR